jgi:hypothetical protein
MTTGDLSMGNEERTQKILAMKLRILLNFLMKGE